jgi:hypothetical protein
MLVISFGTRQFVGQVVSVCEHGGLTGRGKISVGTPVKDLLSLGMLTNNG